MEKAGLLFKNKFFIYIFILLAIDIATKQVALRSLEEFQSYAFIPFIDFYLTFNSGIAFGFLDLGQRTISNLLTFVGILIVIFLINLLQKESVEKNKLALSFVIGGALGNILDRIPDGYVTDFLHLKINNFSFFIFNFADASISIGAILLIYMELFSNKRGSKN